MEKAPEITACEAIAVASVDMITSGITPHVGTKWKNGLATVAAFAPSRSSNAP